MNTLTCVSVLENILYKDQFEYSEIVAELCYRWVSQVPDPPWGSQTG